VLDRLLYRDAPRRLDSRFLTIAGGRVHERYALLERPGAPTVVLVHGIGVSSRYLLPTAGYLATRCSVHVPDLPGSGRSSRLRGRPTVRRLGDALEAWLDAAGLARPSAFVANSFGCQLVLDLAARHPERVPRLVLVGPTVDRHARSIPHHAARLALDITREPVGLLAIQSLDYSLHLAKSGVGGFVEMMRDPVESKLARVAAPTLVVRGARDPIVPRAWAEEVAATLPHGRLVEVEGAAHAVNYADPDALARVVRTFLGRARQA
jgi:pimeloyl-ACP methyl ester carboxylesterase